MKRNSRRKIIAYAAVIALLFSGCGRREVEYATEENSPSTEQNGGQYISAETLGAEKKWEDRVGIGETAIVSISAEVIVPETSQMHIVTAKKKIYSTEEKKNILEQFAEGEIYCYTDEEESNIYSGEGKPTYQVAEDFSGSQYVIRYMGLDYRVYIDDCFSLYPVGDYWSLASEEVKEALASTEYVGFYGGDLEVPLLAPQYETADNDCGISIAQAQEFAKDFLEKAGIWGFEPVRYSKLCWVEADEDGISYFHGDRSNPTYGMEVELRRTIDQVPVDACCYIDPPYYGNDPEYISLSITEQGVIQAFYGNMLEETGVESGNVTLLSYDDACEAVRRSIEEHPERPAEQRYTRFELLYYRQLDEGSTDTFHIIPVWRLSALAEPGIFINQSITINAIDGTYIDENLEYLNMMEK